MKFVKRIFRVVAGTAEGKPRTEYLTQAGTWTDKREGAHTYDLQRQRQRDEAYAALRTLQAAGTEGAQLED